MKLYLSSYRIGSRGEELAAMLGTNKHVAIVRTRWIFPTTSSATAQVGSATTWPASASLALTRICATTSARPKTLRDELRDCGGLWVVGGNTFVLRRAMTLSGLDAMLQERADDDAFTYEGYSAGACVLAPTLRGIHLADQPEVLPPRYCYIRGPEGLLIGLAEELRKAASA